MLMCHIYQTILDYYSNLVFFFKDAIICTAWTSKMILEEKKKKKRIELKIKRMTYIFMHRHARIHINTILKSKYLTSLIIKIKTILCTAVFSHKLRYFFVGCNGSNTRGVGMSLCSVHELWVLKYSRYSYCRHNFNKSEIWNE